MAWIDHLHSAPEQFFSYGQANPPMTCCTVKYSHRVFNSITQSLDSLAAEVEVIAQQCPNKVQYYLAYIYITVYNIVSTECIVPRGIKMI